jgi:hypothetical protein
MEKMIDIFREHGERERSVTGEEVIAILRQNGVSSECPESIPFALNDTTAGTETELQAAVRGAKESVDLAVTIEESNYYANIVRRAASGDASKKLVSDLEKFLHSNDEGVWENSLVRFPRAALSSFADAVFQRDLLSNKNERVKGLRSDVRKFIISGNGEDYVRVPISYLLKIALADVIGRRQGLPRLIKRTGYEMMHQFTNDNTSPETSSFHVTRILPGDDLGKKIARETSRRFLLTQLLMIYANEKFLLKQNGQEAMVFFSPHPPVRQKRLNECISDTFYRELFMSPCLSGWDQGEVKHNYMHLCHEVLSRSQLNAVLKLKDAGIIMNNLAVLPNVSNISLANNGTHVSLGSIALSRLLQDKTSGFTGIHEKYTGDLVVKVVEHFLPLFAGTYSASPYRIDFRDFHPERVLGFLPHELDFTHLRMIWRRWRKKAKIRVLNHSITPFGPMWLDQLIGSIFRLKGDFIPDFRLIDYLVSLMSTEQSPALNGKYGNTMKLKKDLKELGIFHPDMSLYLLYKPREYDVMGFSGYEGRYYSLFESFERDLGYAVNMQNLITAMAYKYVLEGTITHDHIPDSPFLESERRQIIFCSAIGLPTFYVRSDTRNAFIKRIIKRTVKVRQSTRYPGYLRVKLNEYCKALADIISEDGRELIEMAGIRDMVSDFKLRINDAEGASAMSRLTKGILDETNIDSPFRIDSDEFNLSAERYYRNSLRKRHVREALALFEEDLRAMDRGFYRNDALSRALRFAVREEGATQFMQRIRGEVIDEKVSPDNVVQLIYLVIIVEYFEQLIQKRREEEHDTPPIYRAGNA